MMIPEHHLNNELSQTGQRRRRQLLSDLQGEVETVARRRNARKVTGISAVVLALVCGVTWSGMALYNSRSSPSLADEHQETHFADATTPSDHRDEAPQGMFVDAIVGNQPDVISKYLVSSKDIESFSFQYESVADDSLQQTLTECGSETLVAMVDNHLVLWEPGK